MISHLTLGTNNLDLIIQFYDCVLASLGAKQLVKAKGVILYAFSNSKLALTKPHDKNKATFGNGTMLVLKAKDEQSVINLYQTAIVLNAICEGKSGPRNNGAYFAAYFRDLDGNQIVIFQREESVNA